MSGVLFFCCDERRRAQVRTGGSPLNGIDFREEGDVSPAPPDRQRLLRVTVQYVVRRDQRRRVIQLSREV